MLRSRRWGRRKFGPEEVRRINLQTSILTAERGGGNRMLVDVVGPYVLPDASAEADSMISLLAAPFVYAQTAASAAVLVHRNGTPSIHIRCMITASRRATAT